MVLFGKTISLIAILLYGAEWRKLERDLSAANTLEPFVPNVAQHVLILAEDHRFFRHGGVDIISICRAIWRRASNQSIEGGSTLEQQLVRVLTGRYERTLKRKFREICLATLVTRVIPKTDIPRVYLCVAYFGWSMNGFGQACDRLGFNPRRLTVAQAADVLSRLKYPQPKFLSRDRAHSIQRRRSYLVGLYYRSLGASGLSRILEPTHETF